MLKFEVSYRSHQRAEAGAGEAFLVLCEISETLVNLAMLPQQEPPNLLETGEAAPSIPKRPAANARAVTPPAASQSPAPTQGEIEEQRRMLEQYERKQAALVSQREAEQRKQQEEKERQERDFAEQQRQQQERERLAQEQLLRDQMAQQYNQQQHGQSAQMAAQIEREMLAMRGQYERDQMLLEQYDRVSDETRRSLQHQIY